MRVHQLSSSSFFQAVVFSALAVLISVTTLPLQARADANDLSLSTTNLPFGNVVVGQSRSQHITISNKGNSEMTITELRSSNGSFAVSGFELPKTLPAGVKLQATVTFAPTATGWAGGHLMIASNTTYQMLSVGGTGVGANASEAAEAETAQASATTAKLFLDPATLSFGSVATGSSKTLTFQLHPTNGAVTVSSIASSNSEFAVSGVSFPLKLTAGKNVLVTVKFTPKGNGQQSGNMTIVSTAQNSPKTETLSGTGSGATAHSVSLSWTGSTSSVSGYNVYRSTSSTGTYARMNSSLVASTAFKDTSVASGTTYFYATTAVNSKGQESSYSNKVQVAVP